jgi:hypothetical protein
MTDKRTRDIGAYDPVTDGYFFYRLGQAIILASAGAVVWFIHTYIGWWNFLLALIGLTVLGVLVAPRYFKYLPELRFTSLDDRPHGGEVMAYEYGLSDEEMDEIAEVERILGETEVQRPPVDPTDKAEVTLWRLIFLAIPAFMFFGWLQPDSTVSLVQVIVSAILAILALWWWSRLLNLEE